MLGSLVALHIYLSTLQQTKLSLTIPPSYVIFNSMDLLQEYINYDVDVLEGHTLEYDTGGWTRYGLTSKYDNLTKEELEVMTPEQAKQIYYQKLKPIYDKLIEETNNPYLAIYYLDTVNLQGESVAKQMLLFAQQHPDVDVQLARALYWRMQKLYDLGEASPYHKYQNGWLKRVAVLYALIMRWKDELATG